MTNGPIGARAMPPASRRDSRARHGAEAVVDDPPVEDVDPERLAVCAYWRCGELFERRTPHQIYCRKACRSRQNKWERAQARRARRESGRATD